MRAFLSITAGVVCFSAFAAREVVQIADDGVTTVPANSIATPAQVTNAKVTAQDAYNTATGLSSRAEICVEKLHAYGTNYVVTSTVYVQSIGGVPYDPSNQVVRLLQPVVTATNVEVVVTVRQVPLVTPAIDWRATLGAGSAWSNVTATATQFDVPEGVTNAAAAYLYRLPRLSSSSMFIRAVDNSTGASGSGLWWIVFGGISVDGKPGFTGDIIVTVDGQQITLPYHGGILSEPEPLGGM